jgi:UDPglucose 6-dehydrogenase
MININRNVVCIGAGYIGGPTMAVIAKMNPDRKVIAVDSMRKPACVFDTCN